MEINVEKLTPAGQGNYQKIKEGMPSYEDFQEMTKEPGKHQEAFLMKLLRDNKDTELGKKYGFADITSIEEYQQRVPISTYDDYMEYILRMTDKGDLPLPHLLSGTAALHRAELGDAGSRHCGGNH